MTIESILKKVSTADKKKAKAFLGKIREFEEIKAGVFAAFVDDGAESMDVGLSFSPSTKEIKEITCDCSSKRKYCHHKIALLSYLNEGYSSSGTIARKIVSKKASKADKLMSQVDDDDKILDWLREKLNNDKVLRLAFENELLQSQTTIDAAFLQQQFKAAYKTVIGRKKNANAGELPKLLKLIQPYFEQALTTIFNQPSSTETNKLYQALLELSSTVKFLPKRSTTRTDTFIKNCLKNTLPQIPTNSEHIWKLGQLLIAADHNVFNNTDILHPVLSTYGNLLSKEKIKKLLITRLKSIMKYMTSEKIPISYIELSQNLDVFSEISSSFKLESYQNKYNKALLSALMKVEQYDRVKKECINGVNYNTPKYQGMYFSFLQEIAQIQNDDTQLFDIIMLKLKSSPLFEDYQILYQLPLNKKQKAAVKKYSEKIVLSSNYGAYLQFIQMKFLYWHEENTHQLILDKLNDEPRLAFAYPFWDILWSLDSELFIFKVANIFKYFGFFNENDLRELALDYIKTNLAALPMKKKSNFEEQTHKALIDLGIELKL